jgi:hypothetical protein
MVRPVRNALIVLARRQEEGLRSFYERRIDGKGHT